MTLGWSVATDVPERDTEIRILNGTAQMRLETQIDSTVDWIEVEPYQIRCEPVE